ISFYATDIVVVALLLWWAARRAREWRPQKWNVLSASDKALIFFLAISFASLVASGFQPVGVYRWLKLFEFSVVFLCVRSCVRQARDREVFVRAIAVALIAAALLESILAIGQFMTQKDLGLQLLGESRLGARFAGVAKLDVGGAKLIRAYGLFPHPNVLAAFLGIAVLLLGRLYAHVARRMGQKVIIWVTLGILTFGLMLTFSRAVTGSLVLVVAVTFVWSFVRREEYVAETRYYGAGLFLFLVLWAVILSPFLLPRLSISQSEGAVTERVFYGKVALEMIKQNPLLGVGIGGFVAALPRFLGPGAVIPSLKYPVWILQPVHSIYLLVASEIGLLSLLASLFFLIFLVRESKDLLTYQLISLFVLVGLFDHFFLTLQQGSLLFWGGLALVSAIRPRS
ncbi:MAG: O-antigen ligase family protein, partial [Parcubacteria group bacterium]|nr:O-antigen ligase family protein [Parcubacteria group bacterium]